MSNELWAIIVVGAIIVISIDMAAKKICGRLEVFIRLATKDRYGDMEP